jgi:hypothetical protein
VAEIVRLARMSTTAVYVLLPVDVLRARSVVLERDIELEGASGHRHKPSLYLPKTATVIEPVGGERPWTVASAVYVEFGDLRSADGYRLLAVLDDRDTSPGPTLQACSSRLRA